MDYIEKRQAVIDRVFPDGEQLGVHKFDAESGRCKQCSKSFSDCCTRLSDDSYTVERLCPVIGADEVAKFRIEEE